MKRVLILVLLLGSVSCGAWDPTKPADNQRYDLAIAATRDNFAALDVGDANVVSVYNVKAYGATGDGVTDDTSAIQSALDAAYATTWEAIVYLPHGNYEVTKLTVYKGLHLVGDGPQHTQILQASGETDFLLTDDTTNGGFSIWIEGIEFDGNSNSHVEAMIKLGYGVNPLGVFSRIQNCVFTDGGAIGLKLNGNVAILENIEIATFTSYSLWLDGAGNKCSNIFVTGANPTAIGLSASGNSLQGIHIESAHSTSGLQIDADAANNTISDVYCLVGAGLTTGTVIGMSSGARNNHLMGIVTTVEATGTLTNGVVYDQSMATDRIVSGKNYGTFYLVPSYVSNVGWVASWGEAAAPTTGTWLKGDYVFHSSPDAGEAIGWVCRVPGSPGTWEDMVSAATEGLEVRNGSTSAGYVDLYEDTDDGVSKLRIITQALSSSKTITLPILQTYTPSNVVTTRTYNADASSVAELADVLGTLIADLQAAGIVE